MLLLPWAVWQSRTSINGDTAWLLIAARRFLQGDSYTSGFFENNPPLSIWVHAPPVLLTMLTGIPLWYAAPVFFTLLIAASLYLSCRILEQWDFFDDAPRRALLFGFITGATIVPSVSFGERDHLILLGVMPFVLAQLSLTWNLLLPKKLRWVAFIFGAVLILLKPHFGIVPVALLLHRMVKHKKIFGIFKDRDFVVLAGTTLVYAGAIFYFTPDYITTVLPVALKTYIGGKNMTIAVPELALNFSLIAIFLALEYFSPQQKGDAREITLALFVIALLCLIPYAVQMKGFYYHLLPALGFFYAGLGIFMQGYTAQYVRPERLKNIATIALIFGMAYGTKPLLLNYPTHNDYLRLPLAASLKEQCAQPCTFFAFHDNIEIMPQTALYTGSTYASRFPSLWFLPALYTKKNMTDDEQKVLKHQFAGYLAQDLNRYQPSVLYLALNLQFEADVPFDLVKYFSDDADFKKVMKKYRKSGTLEMNRRDYLRGTALDRDEKLTYDIYKLR